MHFTSKFRNWREVIATCNLSKEKEMDFISKWLIIIRPCVFSMTFYSGVIGGFLALEYALKNNVLPSFNWIHFLIVIIGLLIAHATSNMANDYFDAESGLDTSEYVRAAYAPHPILSGLISKSGLARTIVISVLILLAITVYFTIVVDPLVLVIGLLGIIISIFYVAPPIRLKSKGLGEFAVFLVWGPFMIGITYLVTIGDLPPEIFILSLPYAITVMTVLIGKHVDKIKDDKKKGISTLPVIIGEKAAKLLNIFLMFSFYVLVVGSVLMGLVGIGVLISVIGIYRFVIVARIYLQPKPSSPPPNYPVWPLWYVSHAFWHNKLAGGLFVLGLLINVLLLMFAPNLAYINMS